MQDSRAETVFLSLTVIYQWARHIKTLWTVCEILGIFAPLKHKISKYKCQSLKLVVFI